MSLYLGDKKVCPIVYTGSGSGSTISAINKTGSAITKGDKVWINDRVQVGGENVVSLSASVGSSNNHSKGYIDRTGTWCWAFSKYYSLSLEENSATEIGSFTGTSYDLTNSSNYIKYGPNGSIFISTGRCDNKAVYTFESGSGTYIGGNYKAYLYDTRTLGIEKFDINTGKRIQTYGDLGSYTTDKSYNYCIMLHSVNPVCLWFYDSATIRKYILNDEDGTYTRSTHDVVNANAKIWPVGVTLDNKYVVGVFNHPQYSVSTSEDVGCLRIIDISDFDNCRTLTQEEMPVDLQKYYTTQCYLTFNPYTGVLACCERNGIDYTIAKYNSNTGFEKLSIDLGLTKALTGPITFSDDMTRIAYNQNPVADATNTETLTTIFKNLTTTSGYAAIPYKYYNINENTVTGIAADSATADETFTVNVAGE